MSNTPTAAGLSTPVPPTPLSGHCSVVFNSNGVDVLYTYQANAFQSLPLQAGAKWASLPMGVPVNGAKCVLGQWNHQDALIVVGGTPTDAAPKDYPGLQFFTFSTRTWASIPAGNSVTQNRLMHNAVFLNSSNSLLVYSGFQDNSYKQSSETFTIVAEPPYTIQSHPAAAPLSMNPMLLPWNGSHAVMLGGSQGNHAVWLFSKEQEWKELGVNMPPEVSNMSAVQAATLNGINDAKVVQLFDFMATPNTVKTVMIQAADSIPSGGNVVPRDIDLGNLPAYNGTGASHVDRIGYSLAQSRSAGMVVVSGGTGDAASPVVMFNQTANGWVDPSTFFSGSKNSNNNIQSVIQSSAAQTATGTAPTATSSTESTSTSAAATPSSSVATGGDGLSDNGRTILGAVLGGLAGAGALLILLLLFLRWRKQKRQNRAKLYHQEDKNQMGFDDPDDVAGFKRSASRGSQHAGRDDWKRMPTAQEKLGATISKPNLVYDSLSPTGIGSREITKPLISSTLPPTKTKSDDGWGQYFGKSSSSNGLISDSEDQVRLNNASRQTDYTVSNYDIESHTASVYHDNDHDTAPLNPTSSEYPQSEESWEQSRLHPGRPTARSNSAYRPGTAISEEESEAYLDASPNVGGTKTWDSLGPNDGTGGFGRRPTSSMYTDSINYPHPGDKVNFSSDNEASGSKANTNNSWRSVTDSSSKAQKDDMSWLNLGSKK